MNAPNKKGKLENWKATNDRYVAIIDILGFKNMVYQNSHEEVLETLKSFNASFGCIGLPTENKEFKDFFYKVTFSDSSSLYSLKMMNWKNLRFYQEFYLLFL